VTPVESFDVVVVGAGPAGSVAARFAAAAGVRTLLVDRRPELGEPVQCGEYVPSPEELATIFPFPDVIREAFEVPPETVLRETSTMACIAPGGYAWMIPRAHDANVGVGVRYLPGGETLSTLLDRLTHDEGWALATDRTRWWVPLGPPPRSAVRGRALFAGDAANLVMATNGGGIPTAMISGRDAGVAAAAHVRTGAPLTDYDGLWRRHLYEPLRRGFRLKEFGDRFVERDWLLALGMRYIGAAGLDAMMRMRRPRRLGGAS
jgi:flavin-dependent dehydrogenase